MSELQDTRRMLDQAERAASAGDLASADELLTSAARIQEAELGPLHPDLASTLNNRGIIAERTGRPSDAEAFYRRAAAIASASLPSDHPIVVDSRKTLEDFCRERGLPIDSATVTAPAPDSIMSPSSGTPLSVARSPTPAAIKPVPPALHGTSRPLVWVAIGVVALVIAALFVRRGSSPPQIETSIPTAAPTAQRAAEPPLPPPITPAPIEEAQPPTVASRGSSRGVVPDKQPAVARSAVGISLTTAQLCQTFSTSGGDWRCDQIGDAVSRRPIVLYTRVRSPRDTVVVHRWYRGDTLRQSAKLTIRANTTEGYRTFSRMTVDGVGNWRVDVRSAGGALLYEQRFSVR
jgi:hypothetical protein